MKPDEFLLLIFTIVVSAMWVIIRVRTMQYDVIRELDDLAKSMTCGKDQEIVYRRRNFLLHGNPLSYSKDDQVAFLKTIPKNGDKIILTWLPNPVNNPSEKSCYIGSNGIVEEMKPNGSFVLNMGGGKLIVGSRYKWEYA